MKAKNSRQSLRSSSGLDFSLCLSIKTSVQVDHSAVSQKLELVNAVWCIHSPICTEPVSPSHSSAPSSSFFCSRSQ